MDYTIEDFKRDIEEVLVACQEEIQAIQSGEKRDATVWQIEEYIIPEMEDLLEKIKTGSLPEKKSRYISAAQQIMKNWSWDIRSDEKLTDLIGWLDTNYHRLEP
ncbi:MAG: hypothetical protein FWH40_05670 [Coriobacteriia bacterium]|nr:hypothetical protein [Coriobacteriia bacterium]